MVAIYRCEQGSMEWHQLRLGKPTSSMFHRIITPKTAELSKQARPYLYRLVAERLFSEAFEDNLYERVEWIERGSVNEPRALRAFTHEKQLQLDRIGFITDNSGRFGCSPDALVAGRNESVEIKCPQPWTQIGRLLDGMDEKYRPQIQGQLWIGEFDSGHFYSWHEQTPAFYLQTLRDEAYIVKLQSALRTFADELDQATNQARKMGGFLTTALSERGAQNILEAG